MSPATTDRSVSSPALSKWRLPYVCIPLLASGRDRAPQWEKYSWKMMSPIHTCVPIWVPSRDKQGHNSSTWLRWSRTSIAESCVEDHDRLPKCYKKYYTFHRSLYCKYFPSGIFSFLTVRYTNTNFPLPLR